MAVVPAQLDRDDARIESADEAGGGLSMIAAKTPNNDQGDGTIERMAAAMVIILEEQEDCLPHDLLGKDFSIEEINRYWAKAKAMAVFEARISKR